MELFLSHLFINLALGLVREGGWGSVKGRRGGEVEPLILFNGSMCLRNFYYVGLWSWVRCRSDSVTIFIRSVVLHIHLKKTAFFSFKFLFYCEYIRKHSGYYKIIYTFKMLFLMIKKCDRSKYSTVSKVYTDFDWKMNNLVYSIAVKWYFKNAKMPKTYQQKCFKLFFIFKKYIFIFHHRGLIDSETTRKNKMSRSCEVAVTVSTGGV